MKDTPSTNSRTTVVHLLLASFCALYFELFLIRWIPTTLHVIGFFNNLVLIACFLGLGVGMAGRSAAERGVWQAVFRLAVLSVVMLSFLHFDVAIQLAPGSDYGTNEFTTDHSYHLPLYVVLPLVFGLIVWANVPLGRLVGGYFDRLDRIPAYSVNIAGSLLGVLAFTLVAWLELAPLAWAAVGLACLWCLDRRPVTLIPAAVVLGALVAQQHFLQPTADTQLFWSPYYKVMVTPSVTGNMADGFTVRVNDQFMLTGLHMDPASPLPASVDAGKRTSIQHEQLYHEFPFQLRRPRRVLVLGAGVGNDVSLALRFGAERVVAVELDPVILKLGTQHPDHPYADPRVEVVYNDARAYLRNADETFDLVLFATLDAHGMLSSAGNLRLDSFVYTQESLEAARRRLTPDGLLVLSFGPFREVTQYRQFCTLRNVFGVPPQFFLYTPTGNQTLVAGNTGGVVAGPGVAPNWRAVGPDEIRAKLAQLPTAEIPATDDWPHLYLAAPRVPNEYVLLLLGILALSAGLVFVHFREGFRLDGHFFFLGAGFLLMETKGIAELSLLLGSTWQVNALVFVVILLVILLANLLVLRAGRRMFVPLAFGLLGLTLLAEYFWPAGSLGGSAAPVFGAVGLGLPIFLAAVVFATTFADTRVASAALASNLLGSVFGGVAEYLSLALGIRFLSLLALLMYAAAFLFWLWSLRRVNAPAAKPEML